MGDARHEECGTSKCQYASGCAHGAASGKPDRSVIFYLKSRGIPQNEAEKIYVEGFLGEFLDKIPNAEMQQKAMKYISANC